MLYKEMIAEFSEVHTAYTDKLALHNGEILLNLVVQAVTARFNGVKFAVFGKPRSTSKSVGPNTTIVHPRQVWLIFLMNPSSQFIMRSFSLTVKLQIFRLMRKIA